MAKRKFRLEGLDCANCASKIEKEITGLDGVTAATLNFMTAKLTIEAEDGRMDVIADAAARIVRKYEPDVVMKKA